MANGYGYSSSSSSSSSARQSTTNTQGQTAPPGFHYMPDGTLMSDAEHAKLYGASNKVITSFNIDTRNIKARGERRKFNISATKGSVFSMQIINNHGHYYNFDTEVFSATESMLRSTAIKGGQYSGIIKFPKLSIYKQIDSNYRRDI